MKLSLKEFFVREAKSSTKSSAKHSSINIDVKSSAQVNIKECETPDYGDSKWATPYSKKERMPHQNPQNDAQQNSVDGWNQACEEGPHQKSSKELKKFFGGSPYPKTSKKEAFDPSDNQKRYPGVEPVFKGDDMEIPMGSLDDYGTGFGEEDWEHAGTQDPYEMKPSELRKWAGSDDSPIEKSFMYDDEPQHGHNPFDPNWADTTAFNDDEPIRTSKSSGEGFDDGEDVSEAAPADESDDEAFLDSLMSGDPVSGTDSNSVAKGGAGAADEMEGDLDFSALDDEDFLAKLGMEPSPQPKSRSAKASYEKGDEMTWDELRANHPEEAEEAVQSFPGHEDAKFRVKSSGFMNATLPNGRRMFYMGDGRGWMDMDDDSPSGEF